MSLSSAGMRLSPGRFVTDRGANKFTPVAHLGDPVGPVTAGIASPSRATRFGCSASGGHNAAGGSSEASFSRPAKPKRCALGYGTEAAVRPPGGGARWW